MFQFEVGYCRRRRFEVEDLLWENQLNLEDYKLYAAFYGGPIALLRDNKRIVRVTSGPGASQKPFIYLFTPAGREIGSIKVQDINAYHFFFQKKLMSGPPLQPRVFFCSGLADLSSRLDGRMSKNWLWCKTTATF